MTKLDLLTPLCNSQGIAPWYENYLALGNTQAQLTNTTRAEAECVVQTFRNSSAITTALKVLSYVLTLGFAPLLAFACRVYARSKRDFVWIDQIDLERQQLVRNFRIAVEGQQEAVAAANRQATQIKERAVIEAEQIVSSAQQEARRIQKPLFLQLPPFGLLANLQKQDRAHEKELVSIICHNSEIVKVPARFLKNNVGLWKSSKEHREQEERLLRLSTHSGIALPWATPRAVHLLCEYGYGQPIPKNLSPQEFYNLYWLSDYFQIENGDLLRRDIFECLFDQLSDDNEKEMIPFLLREFPKVIQAGETVGLDNFLQCLRWHRFASKKIMADWKKHAEHDKGMALLLGMSLSDPDNPAAANKYFGMAAQQGSLIAKLKLGLLDAVLYCRKGEKSPNFESLMQFADLDLIGCLPMTAYFCQQYELVLPLALLSDQQGSVWGAIALGIYYRNKDPKKSFSYFQKTYLKKTHLGMLCLAKSYERGIGTPSDLQKALAVYQELSNLGADMKKTIEELTLRL